MVTSDLIIRDVTNWGSSFFCILSGMNSSDWAAWIQAIGTILAVAAAARIASNQHKVDKQREFAAEKLRRDQVARLCVVYAHQALVTFAEIVRGCSYQNIELISRQTSKLEDIVDFGRSIDISAIPADAVITFMELRGLSSEGLRDAKYVCSEAVSWAHWASRFDEIRAKVSELATDLHVTLGDSFNPVVSEGDTLAAPAAK
jgi:hypothetical protein